MLTAYGMGRMAYAHGWALSGGPLTPRVRAGLDVASEMAAADPGRPGVLEALAELGYWEGIAAAVSARRDQLEQQNLVALAGRWRALVALVDRDRLVRQLLRRLTHGLAEAAARPPLNPGTDWESLAQMVQAALERAAGADREGWQQTRQAFRDALARGQAEGRATAITAAARKLDRPGTAVDTAQAYADGVDGLKHVAGLWTEADTWLHTLMGYQSRDIGRAIAALEQPDEESVRGILAEFLDDPDARAVQVAIDQLTGRAVIDGVLQLFASSGVTSVYVEAQNGACPRCLDIASRSPYRIGAQPPVPVHPNCRCDVHPDDQVLPESVISPYLRTRS